MLNFFLIFFAILKLKKSLNTVSPFFLATLAMLVAGSTPTAWIPKSLNGFNKTPSFEPNSTTKEFFSRNFFFYIFCIFNEMVTKGFSS